MTSNYNKFKDSTFYGNLKNSDNPSGNQANVIFDRNLTVSGIINTSKIQNNSGAIDISGNSITINGLNSSKYITSQNLATPSTSLIPSSHGTFYSNGGSPYFSYNTGSVINSYVLATISNLSSYLTTSSASSTYQTIAGMSNYLTTANASSIYQTIANMSNYIQNGGNINFNVSNAKLSFPSIFPTAAVADNNAGIGFYWNNSGYVGETDMVCFGQGGLGGLFIYGAGNTQPAILISKMLIGYIEFFTNPIFPTSTTVGNYGATTQYVNDRLTSYLTTANASSTYQTIANMSNYLTTANASSTYQTISNMSSYLTTSSASSTYQTIVNMANYVNTSSNNTFTGTQTFNNNLYSNTALHVNGLDTSNEIIGFNNITFTSISSNTVYN